MSETLRQQASTGDIEAMRKLAEGYRSGCAGIAADAVLACGWRIVIQASGDPKRTETDIEGRRRDCEQLSADQQAAAVREAKQLFSQIFGGNRPRAPR